MDPGSLVDRTGAVFQLARAIQRSLAQAVTFLPESFSACQTEIADLVHTLQEIETVYAADLNLAQAAFLSVRLGRLNSTLTVLRNMLAKTGNLAQVKDNGGFIVGSLTRSWEEDEVQRMMRRIRAQRLALTSTLITTRIDGAMVKARATLDNVHMQMSNMRYSLESLDVLRHSLIKTATERDLDSGDSQDSALQISRHEEPQPKALDDLNRFYDRHGRLCNPKCPCSCHRWRFFQSPTILKGVAGSLRIIHNIVLLSMRRCDDANCFGRTAKKVADMSYIFPRWICNRVITLTLETPNYGSNLLLRLTKMNPNIISLYRTATELDGLHYVLKLLKEDLSTINDVDANGDTILHFAVRDLNLECVQLLLQRGADMNIRNLEGCSPYSIAWEEILTHKHAWEVETLTSWCSLFGEERDYEEPGLPPLHRAYFGKSDETFEEVLSVLASYDIDQVDRNGRTLLCWAAKTGDCETVSKLLSCGANPNHVDNSGFSPLHRSLQPPTSIISATVLLGANAYINARSGSGHTALSIAAGQKDGNSGMIILLMFGADPESEDSEGRTPMFQAAENNKPKNISYLMKAGANIGHVSVLGQTVIDEAVRKNSHDALKFLVPHTFPGKHAMIPMRKDTLSSAAIWGDTETLDILAHGFWANFDINGVDDQGLSAKCHASFRRDSNNEWSKRYCRPPEDVMLRWERFTAFEKLIETIAKMQQRSVDEQSEDEERWKDASERVEGNFLPEALQINQQSQAIFRDRYCPTYLNNPSTFMKLWRGVSEAFSAKRIKEILSAVVFNRLGQVLPYVLCRSSWGRAFRLSAVIVVGELSKGFTRIIQTLEFSDPPVAKGKIRIRWRCIKCGRNMYDDFQERRPGAVKELEIFLNQGVNRCAGPNDIQSEADVPGNSISQEEGGGLPQQQSAEKPLALAPLSNTYDPRPQFRQQQTIITNCDAEGRWLLICAKSRKRPNSLSHLDMCTTSSDKKLFTALRDSYMAMRGKWSQRLSLKGVKKIQFVKFELHIRNLVDVKFPAMPPKEKFRTEYLYEQYDTFPPVGENFMAHLFSHPEHANEMSITCLRAPKKLKEKLTVCPQQGTREGWGIHLVEAWVPSRVWLLILFLFLLGSLIFGICWAIFEHDIQGAFGVSGYIVTLAAIVVGTAQTNWADT